MQNELDNSPWIAFAGGGTGGHLYPALAVADALRERWPDVRFAFFSTQREVDHRVLDRTDLELIGQTLPPLSPVPWRWPRVLRGFHQASLLCRSRFERQPPAVVIGTGGLGSVPAIREASRMGIPTAVLNPDALPGRANRHLARLTDVVFAQWEETAEHLPRDTPVVVSGCAVRPEFNQPDRSVGIERFGLDGDRKTLLVTGASQGARTINEAVLSNLEFLASFLGWQVLHLTGERDFLAVRETYRKGSVRGSVVAFTDHMADALAAADLVVSRAGASTLAEITAVGRPSILMPYPYCWDQHQLANARCLVRASAARILHDTSDPAVNGPGLRRALQDLMEHDERRESMSAAARRIGLGNAAPRIADHILTLARRRGLAPSLESVEASW